MIEYVLEVRHAGLRTVRVWAMDEDIARRKAEEGESETLYDSEVLAVESCEPRKLEDKDA